MELRPTSEDSWVDAEPTASPQLLLSLLPVSPAASRCAPTALPPGEIAATARADPRAGGHGAIASSTTPPLSMLPCESMVVLTARRGVRGWPCQQRPPASFV